LKAESLYDLMKNEEEKATFNFGAVENNAFEELKHYLVNLY